MNYNNLNHDNFSNDFSRFDEIDNTVKIDDELYIENWSQWLKDTQQTEGEYAIYFDKFLETKIDKNNLKYHEYLQYLIENGQIQGNHKLYSHIKDCLDVMIDNNLLHEDKKNEYIKSLNTALYTKEENYIKENQNNHLQIVDYKKYFESDYRIVIDNELLNKLDSMGGEIYINNKDKFLIKLSANAQIEEYTKKGAESLLRNIFKCQVKIIEGSLFERSFQC